MDKIKIQRMSAQEKVIAILDRVAIKFGSASLLAGAVEQFGLFHGTVSMGEGEDNLPCWVLSRYFSPAVPHAYSGAAYGWSSPEFSAFWSSGCWTCCVGFGRHGVCLRFSEAGQLLRIEPDETPSARCWRSDSEVERVEEIRGLLACEHGDKKEVSR